MPEAKNKIEPQDSSRVNVNEDYKMHYWISKFSCSKEQLQKAIDAVTQWTDKIEKILARK